MNANILIDSLPETLIVNGREYSIETNFRTWIQIEMLFLEKDVPEEWIIETALELCYGDTIPGEIESALERVLWFYLHGKDPEDKPRNKRGKSESIPKRIYDYDHDGGMIYSAFLGQYGIDLQDIGYLHWWKFKAMFESLNEDQLFSKVMGYRSINLASIKDKETRKHYAELQALYRLPKEIDEQDRVSRAGAIFAGGLG